MTQPTCPSEAPNSSRMLGTVTLTIEVFRTATKTAAMSTASSSRADLTDCTSSAPALSGGFIDLLCLLSHGLECVPGRLPGVRSQLRRHLDYQPPERLQPSDHPLV